MTNHIAPIPKGYETVTPYLIAKGAAEAIQFYKRAFGATEIMCVTQSGGKVCHAEIMIGTSRIMLADEYPEMNVLSPHTVGGTPLMLHLYVESVDDFTNKAIAEGAKVLRPIQNQFYGDRSGSITDPFGHIWHIASHVEDVSPEEIEKRMQAMKQTS
jgi:PhnB protein